MKGAIFGAIIVCAFVGVCAHMAGASARNASNNTRVQSCPEDADRIVGGHCIPTDDWGVCERMQIWVQQIIAESRDADEQPKRLRRAIVGVAIEGRDIGCNWQREFVVPMIP